MKMLQAPHHGVESPPRSRRAHRKYGWLVVIGSILAAAIFCLRNQDFSRLKVPSMQREAIWWQGIHIDADGREMPRLQLAIATKSQVTGFLETTFNTGFHIRLPILNATPSETDVIFAVEDPHGFSQPREHLWYLLHKTGATTSTLYRLNLGYQTPTAGRMIPTNLDKQHRRVANMTTAQPASTNR